MKKIIIGSDHAGYDLKIRIVNLLVKLGYEVNDAGCFSVESADYPDFAHIVSSNVNNGNYSKGILICGSGNGVCMTANKYEHVRAALCWNKDLSFFARSHNDANILCLPARYINYDTAAEITETFLKTEFEGGRHLVRINKISIK